MNTHRMVGAAAVAIVIGAAMPQVLALGFRNPDQDARATGQGEAFVAQADDASAIYYNPGGLTQIQGTEFTSGGMLSFPDFRLKGAGSGAEMDSMSFIPHFYASTDLGMANSPWRFGLGVNVPFGNQADYASNGPFRYTVTSADLQVINIQPTVAYKFNEHLSLGAGLNIYDATTALNSQLPPPFPSGHFHFDGSGVAFGATAGLMWKITPQHTVGVVYRSPFTVNFKGPTDVNAPGVIKQSNGGQTSLPFPQSVAGGYAFWPVPKLKLEADIEWTNWQPLKKLVLHAPGSEADGETIPFDWMDSLFYEFGVQYQVDKHWTVRGGYIYSTDTVPNSSFSASVPDADRQIFSVGLGYTAPRFTIDLVYQYTLSADRTVNNGSAADGTWLGSVNSVMITTSLKF